MVIYGEYLFLENFITGFLLLLLTAHVTGGAGKPEVFCGLQQQLFFAGRPVLPSFFLFLRQADCCFAPACRFL